MRVRGQRHVGSQHCCQSPPLQATALAATALLPATALLSTALYLPLASCYRSSQRREGEILWSWGQTKTDLWVQTKTGLTKTGLNNTNLTKTSLTKTSLCASAQSIVLRPCKRPSFRRVWAPFAALRYSMPLSPPNKLRDRGKLGGAAVGRGRENRREEGQDVPLSSPSMFVSKP